VVEEYCQDYPVSVLCETLGVSLSGDSAWRKRPLSEHRRTDEVLGEQIQHVYQACRQVYGSPRIHAELQAEAHHEFAQASGASDARARTVGSSSAP
jgi:putative transposase